MENLFGLLKSEPFYLQSFHSIDEVKWELVHYLDFTAIIKSKSSWRAKFPPIQR